MRYLVFYSIMTVMTVGLHSYLWWRLSAMPDWGPPWSKVITVVLIVGALSIPLSFPAWNYLPKSVAVPMVWVGYVWMGMMFFLLVWLLPFELMHLGRLVADRVADGPMSPERRMFFYRTIAGVAAGGAALTSLWGVYSVATRVAEKRVNVTLNKLGKGLDGLRIVQLTDIHIGPTIGKGFIQQVVDTVNKLDADVVAITGDVVDGSVEELGDAAKPLGDIKAKHGVFLVTGNHEYYSGADSWIAYFRSIGIRVLRNERVSIERDGATLDLLGVDDLHSRGFGGDHGYDPDRAAEGRDPARPAVLMAHQPKGFENAVRLGIDLQISGHTHGGQMVPFNWLTRLAQPYVAGLHAEGESQIYVSRGTGYWGPPMRVGAPAEVSVLTLNSAAA